MSTDRDDGILSADTVRRLHDRRAAVYDVATAPYRVVGGYRPVDGAVPLLRLAPGDTVVELGTGTGDALPALAAAAGSSGRVVAVEISARMLGRARGGCAREDLTNVELVQADIADFSLPAGTTAAQPISSAAVDTSVSSVLWASAIMSSNAATAKVGRPPPTGGIPSHLVDRHGS